MIAVVFLLVFHGIGNSIDLSRCDSEKVILPYRDGSIFEGMANSSVSVRPNLIAVDSLLKEFFQIIQGADPKKNLDIWIKSKHENELAVIKIVIGYGILNQIEQDAPIDSLHYTSYLTVIDFIKKGIDAIDKLDNNDMLYLTTKESGMIPARFILAHAYDMVYEYHNADSTYTQTIQEIGRDFGMNSDEFVYWTNQCVESSQRKNKNYAKAISLLLPAKEAAIHSFLVSDSTACKYLISLSQKYYRMGNHKEAMSLAHEAEKKVGGNNTLLFNLSSLLGELYLIDGNQDVSSQYYKTAASYAPTLDHFFSVAIDCANIRRMCGFHDDAENILHNLEKYSSSEDLSVLTLFHYYESLGVLYTFTNPEKSSKYFRKAEQYIKHVDYPSVIRHILDSQIYPNIDNSFKVISALDRAELFYNTLIGNEPRLMNEILVLKGRYLMNIRDYEMAHKYLEIAFDRMLDYSFNDPQIINVLKYLGQLAEIEGDDIRREICISEQLKNAQMHGDSSAVYLSAVSDALQFSIQKGRMSDAYKFYDIFREQQSESFDTYCYGYRLMILENKFADAENMLINILEKFPEEQNVVDEMRQKLYFSQQSTKITEVANDVFINFKNEMIKQLLFMSNSERKNFDKEFRSKRSEIISAISFAPELVNLAFDYSLFSKGLLFHTQSEIGKILAENDSANREIAKIRSLKVDLMRAINALEENMVYILKKSIDSHERYLIEDYFVCENINCKLEQYCSKSVLSNITSNQLLLDFVEYDNGDKTYIGCFVIPNSKTVKFLNLGEVLNLNKKNIYQSIWSKMESYLTKDKSIFFSTDGILNSLSIEFAEDENGVPISEKFNIHRVFHLSDIVKQSYGLGDKVVAIGVSDHNSPIGSAENISRGTWTDLPNVEYEMQLINHEMQGYDFKVFLNDEATEPIISSLSGTPISTLHISTHGFYRSSSDLNEAAKNPSSDDYHIARRFLSAGVSDVSGLVLRQGNISWKSPYILDEHDDLLTADEIELMSFPNLNLTVLSACETGLGEIDSDGVWGLQRAFRIAGAKSLICSLAKVDDYWTAQFMDAFYEQAANGNNIYDSFQSAQRWLRRELPDNPEIWSSFILIE